MWLDSGSGVSCAAFLSPLPSPVNRRETCRRPSAQGMRGLRDPGCAGAFVCDAHAVVIAHVCLSRTCSCVALLTACGAFCAFPHLHSHPVSSKRPLGFGKPRTTVGVGPEPAQGCWLSSIKHEIQEKEIFSYS